MGENEIILAPPASSQIVARPADLDPEAKLIQMWLGRRSRHTIRCYRRGLKIFREFVTVPLDQVRFDHISDFADSLIARKSGPSSSRGILAAVKSFFSFAARIQILPVNISAASAGGWQGRDQ